MMPARNRVKLPMPERIPQHYLYIVRATGENLSLLVPFQAVYTTCVALKFSFETKSRNQILRNLQFSLHMCSTGVLHLPLGEQPHNTLFTVVTVRHGVLGALTHASFWLHRKPETMRYTNGEQAQHITRPLYEMFAFWHERSESNATCARRGAADTVHA